ncbi:MAG: bifunctional folylpolyglutamate synthase/dihydrofolate synthase [Ruminococcus sp.]|nr:bifunctional folylpolyglutamate synthase/dihydrofolate synthase [Ruminococcus sp.]
MNGVDYISTFSRLGKRITDLSRISALMELVGRPQDRLKFIHIAGTNGKGSMAQMFSEVLTRAGYTVGLFTSPYIVSFFDRIRVNNEDIPVDELDGIMSELEPLLEASPLRGELTQFEVTQAAAFKYFERRKCDVVVLEAGLGGLLDSTNVIESPLVSVIGSIALDHTAILGDTVEKIAFQKAGVIKPGCPCVLSAGNPPEAVRVFREQAAKKQSLLCIPNLMLCRVTETGITGSTFTYRGEEYRTTMAGLHQVSNALTVIEALRLIGEELPVSGEAVMQGIAAARLYGRVEILSESPLTVLDGSHNPDGTRALAGFLKGMGGKEVRAVIGMHTDKDAGKAIANLVPEVTEFYPVSGFSDKDYPAAELAEVIRSAGGRAVLTDESIEALIARLRAENPDGVTLIAGSLYLVSYVKLRCEDIG